MLHRDHEPRRVRHGQGIDSHALHEVVSSYSSMLRPIHLNGLTPLATFFKLLGMFDSAHFTVHLCVPPLAARPTSKSRRPST